MFRKKVGSIVLLIAATLALCARVDLPFKSKGVLGVFSPTQDVQFNTDTGAFQIGAKRFRGGRVVKIFSKVVPVEVMTFDFEKIKVPAGAKITSIGARPLILLAEGDVAINGVIDVSGESGRNGGALSGGGGGAINGGPGGAGGSGGSGAGGGGGGGGADNCKKGGHGGSGGPGGPSDGGFDYNQFIKLLKALLGRGVHLPGFLKKLADTPLNEQPQSSNPHSIPGTGGSGGGGSIHLGADDGVVNQGLISAAGGEGGGLGTIGVMGRFSNSGTVEGDLFQTDAKINRNLYLIGGAGGAGGAGGDGVPTTSPSPTVTPTTTTTPTPTGTPAITPSPTATMTFTSSPKPMSTPYLGFR
jgi:hypothetical protein